MKNARSIKDEASAADQGAPIVTPGAYPVRRATVTAEVLARLLAGERLTGLEAVTSASTTRLSAVVHYLHTDYGWRIERTDKATGCRDGRVAFVSVYWLAPEVIALAVAAGAGGWCSEVRAARLHLRTKAAHARRAAERANASRSARPNSGQWSLFDGQGAQP
jgi:hypothetical protein